MTGDLRVLLVTSWGDTICGIAAHSRELIAAVKAADPGITISPTAEGLDPAEVIGREGWVSDRDHILHLNYHAGLHSRWTPEKVQQIQAYGVKVLITYHDTGVPNSESCRALHAVADAFVIHEPAEDLPGAIYWRMGVGEYYGTQMPLTMHQTRRPFLGTAGFDFGWKCYDELARVSKSLGWGFLICCPEMSAEREAGLRAINPWLVIHRGLTQEYVVAALHQCDATAFTYVCHNTGQSAAILLGIAARKPVISLDTCRQMRSLFEDDLGGEAIWWAETFEEVAARMSNLSLGRFDPLICELAEQDSWTKLGANYAALYRGLL